MEALRCGDVPGRRRALWETEKESPAHRSMLPVAHDSAFGHLEQPGAKSPRVPEGVAVLSDNHESLLGDLVGQFHISKDAAEKGPQFGALLTKLQPGQGRMTQ